MDRNHSDKPVGAPAGAQNAVAGASMGGARLERRNFARRKLAAVTRLLRGEPLETVARELKAAVNDDQAAAACCAWVFFQFQGSNVSVHRRLPCGAAG
jgi:hypothetical protein